MASNYPGSFDSFPTITADKLMSDTVGGRAHRALHNDLGDAVEAVQAELGTNPSAAFATVVARLDDLTARLDDLTARVEALEGSTPQAPLLPYGSGIGTDTIANLITGVDQTAVSQKFRADITGTPTFHRWVLKVGGAYSGAATGVHRVSIQADDGTGKPDGTRLDEYTVSSGQVTGHYNWEFDGGDATLIAGNIYHLVIENMEVSPNTNYLSVNNILVFDATTPRQRRYADTDLGVLVRSGGVWSVAPEYTPTFDLTFSNGYHQGQGYVDMQSSSGSLIAGDNMIHEKFTVTGTNRTVSTVWVRLAKHSGTGNLTIRLEDENESLIDYATIAAASITQDTSGNERTDDGKAGTWVSGTFANPQTLQVGSTYHLRLSAPAGTEFWMRLIEQGYANGYSAGHFDDGYAEVSTDSASTWNDTPASINAGQGDLQFYLT